MLVLFRWVGESIYIGDDVKVKVNEVGPGWARLAIDAPKSISIVREELLKATRENKKAAKGNSDLNKQVVSELKNMIYKK